MSVTLQKGKKVNLKKRGTSSLGRISVNLKWNKKPKTRFTIASLFTPPIDGIDLDIGCLYELKNGKKGAIQPLGNQFGNYLEPPYVMLDGDDRTGASKEGETLTINGSKLSEIKRILVYTYIYAGVINWQQADAVITIKYPGAEDIVVKMDSYDSQCKICGLVLFENYYDQTFSVEKIMRFYKGHRDLDEDYGWGMRWVPGRK
ncbi:MAG: TerD family protein [Acutalibacteraceae bacterium]|nr:TerD family protein [Clostridia bacterium]MEE3449359.1 TerD family protein [Acutalibacteraceae bacterium]